jgi:hypothetical protein
MGSLFYQQPLARAGGELRYFVSLCGVQRLENLQLLAFADENPCVTTGTRAQVQGVIACALAGAITVQA